MKNTYTIAKRDFKANFTSPIAYIISALFLFIMGWMFFAMLDHFAIQARQYQQYGMNKGPSISDGVIRPLFGNMNVILLFMVPFITMRMFSEEKKNHTIELLLTSPITIADMVFGKFLAAFGFVLIMLGLTSVYPIVLILTGNPDLGTITASYIGTLLLSSCYIALGITFSAMTENQIVAGALTFASSLFFWLVSWATQSAGPVWEGILGYLSLITHFNNFSQGLIDTSNVIYYFSFAGFCLFVCHRILDSYRWR